MPLISHQIWKLYSLKEKKVLYLTFYEIFDLFKKHHNYGTIHDFYKKVE